MKYSAILLLLISCIACKNNNIHTISEVTVIPVFKDSLSIRAITPVNENKVWFAANKGVVGFMDKEIPKVATIRYEDSILGINNLLHFRSIAKTKEAVFVLSIANPAVLYKIDYDNTKATGIHKVYEEIHEYVFYDALTFFDDQIGIAMGDPIDGCLSIIKTIDGGNSWFKLSCNDLPPIEEGEAAFAASNSNIATYGNNVWIVTGGTRARVFYSPDQGKHWEVFNTPMLQGQSMTGIYSVAFYNDTIGVIFGGNWEDKDFNEGNKAITTDGGKTWQLLSNGKGPGYRSSVKFVPGTYGKQLIAVGSPGISYSSDQGANWTELSAEGFYAIEFVNDSIAFASGANKISKLIFK